jgi:hypothetical protein
MAETKLSDEGVRREIEKRKNAAKELGLPEVVEFLFEELCSYPAWQKTAKEDCFPAIINAREIKVDGVPGVAFVFNGNEYGLGQHDWHVTMPDGDECYSRDYFIYNANENVVFQTTGFFGYDEFGSSYRFRDVEAFTPGNWTKDILELYRELRSFTEQQEANWENEEEANETQELRKKFGLQRSDHDSAPNLS